MYGTRPKTFVGCSWSSGPQRTLHHSLLNGHRVLWAKEEGDLPVCYRHSVQTPASLMVWGCIQYGQLACFGRYYAKRYIKVFEQHMLPSR